MCVKEFLGYNCGHCSIPQIIICPLSTQNPTYPLCQYPAERPIWTNEFCHPCSRVIWNIRVLQEEEEHKTKHERGECICEVAFDGAERERRTRSKPGDKGKGRCSGIRNDSRGHVEPSCLRQDGQPKEITSAYEYVGYRVGLDQVPFAHAKQRTWHPNQHEGEQLGFQQHTTAPAQLTIGQSGAGMKWYPELPSVPVSQVFDLAPTVWQEAKPISTEEPSCESSESDSRKPSRHKSHEFPLQPMVVSSDMILPD